MKWLVVFSLFVSSVALGNSYTDQRKKSSHFRGGQFHNAVYQAKSFWSFLWMRMNTNYAVWPDWVDSGYGHINPIRVEGSEIHFTHINHSTVLIQTEGLNILTDPIFSDRCSPLSWAGPRRVRNPGIKFEDLPPIDIVLISHDHYDHLDLPTIEKLIQRDGPRFYVGLGVGERFSTMHQVEEMDWWDKLDFNERVKIHFVPVQHFSGRTLWDRNSTLWGGFVIELPQKKIYFGGDTGYGPHFRETFDRFGIMDLAILPIGAYEPRGFMAYAHVNPEEAVQAHLDLNSRLSLGVHYGTFQLTAEEYDAPLRALGDALRGRQIPAARFITPAFGEVVKVK